MKSLLVVLVFMTSAAHGEIYTWIDPRGTAHYTNSMYEVPARFRDKVKVLDYGTEQKGGTPQQNGEAHPQEPAAAPKADVTPPRMSRRSSTGERYGVIGDKDVKKASVYNADLASFISSLFHFSSCLR